MLYPRTPIWKVSLFSDVYLIYTFFLIVEIWHDVQNGPGSTLSSMLCQLFTVSPNSSEFLYLCPNLCWNNPKETIFLGIYFFWFWLFLCLTKNVIFICELCGNFTLFCSLSLKKITHLYHLTWPLLVSSIPNVKGWFPYPEQRLEAHEVSSLLGYVLY